MMHGRDIRRQKIESGVRSLLLTSFFVKFFLDFEGMMGGDGMK
jgi:hypothetical protein